MRLLLPLLLLCLSTAASANPQELSLSLETLTDISRDIVMITAHRGGYNKHEPLGAPENSLAAIDRAVALGVDFVETDVRRSKDGEFIIFHDPTLKRTTSGTGRVEDKTLSELRALQLRNNDHSLSKLKIPTLKEFLQHAKDRVFIKFDFKVSLDYLPQAIEQVEAAGSLNQVMFAFRWFEHPGPKIEQLVSTGMPYTKELFMFRVNNVSELEEVLATFDVSFIDIRMKTKEINSEKQKAIDKAKQQGLIVATHAWGNEREWQALTASGVQVLQTRTAHSMARYLNQSNALRVKDCTTSTSPPPECRVQ